MIESKGIVRNSKVIVILSSGLSGCRCVRELDPKVLTRRFGMMLVGSSADSCGVWISSVGLYSEFQVEMTCRITQKWRQKQSFDGIRFPLRIR